MGPAGKHSCIDFSEQLVVYPRTGGRHRGFSYLLPPHIASPTALTRAGHFTKDKPLPTRPSHPKSTVYIRVYSGYCTLYGFWRIHSGVIDHVTIFIVLHTLCALPIRLPPLARFLAATDHTVSAVLPFPECHRIGLMHGSFPD